jgi:hypothetical protein
MKMTISKGAEGRESHRRITISSGEFEKIEKQRRENRQKEIDGLRAKSKPLKELVVTEDFVVEEAICISHATSFTPQSELRLGGSSPSYRGGFAASLILKVKPLNENVPVRTIHFNGFSIATAGDHVSVKILRHEEKNISPNSLNFHSPYHEPELLYFDRPFNEKESAIEISIIQKGKAQRIDRSVEYSKYFKD